MVDPNEEVWQDLDSLFGSQAVPIIPRVARDGSPLKRALTRQSIVEERDERVRAYYKSYEQALVKRISRQFRLPVDTVREILVPREVAEPCNESEDTTEQ